LFDCSERPKILAERARDGRFSWAYLAGGQPGQPLAHYSKRLIVIRRIWDCKLAATGALFRLGQFYGFRNYLTGSISKLIKLSVVS
jgi:hypothetical protein